MLLLTKQHGTTDEFLVSSKLWKIGRASATQDAQKFELRLKLEFSVRCTSLRKDAQKSWDEKSAFDRIFGALVLRKGKRIEVLVPIIGISSFRSLEPMDNKIC